MSAGSRLAKLEAAMRHAGGCPLCRDHPVATVYHLVEAHGRGFRRVREELCEEDRGRITDDLRCRACDLAASVTYLEVIARLYDGAARDAAARATAPAPAGAGDEKGQHAARRRVSGGS